MRLTSKVGATIAAAAVLMMSFGLVERRHFSSDGGSSGGSQKELAQRVNDTAAIPVVAAFAQQRDVPIYRSGLGSVQAFNRVSITSRVDGQLLKLGFTEGQTVKAGDVLAVIDARPYEAQLRQSQAQLRSNEARLVASKGDLDRLIELQKREVATRQAFENKRAEVEQTQAAIESALADIDRSKLQVEYSTIRAPISGRIGLKQIDVGNMILAAEKAPIAVITQLRPISVVFSLPQEDLGDVLKAMSGGRKPSVIAIGRDNKSQLAAGELTTFDNQIDAQSGTFKLKATFANDDDALWPGQFVTAKVLVDSRKDSIVVPSQSVQRGPEGTFVFIISAENTAEIRPVTIAQIQDGEALVTAGLTVGERVVIDGQYRLKAGSPVSVGGPGEAPQQQPASAAPDATSKARGGTEQSAANKPPRS